MPRRKKPDTTPTTGEATGADKRSKAERIKELEEKTKALPYVVGANDIYAAFFDSWMKDSLGEPLETATDYQIKRAWKMAVTTLNKFVISILEYKHPEDWRASCSYKLGKVDDVLTEEEYRQIIRERYEDFIKAGLEIFPQEGTEIAEPPTVPHTLMKPETYTMATSKAARVSTQIVPSIPLDGQIRVADLFLYPPSSKKADVVTYFGMMYEGEGVQMRGRQKITKYDQAVHNAISSLWAAGNRDISPQEIFRTMNGSTTGKVKEAQVKKVHESVNKMMFTRLYLNMSADIQSGGLKIQDQRVTKGVVETQMIQATIVSLQTSNGQTIRGYKLADEPMLYTYSKAKKHVLSVGLDLLDTSDEVSNTDDVIVIREYLLQQIENMRHGYRDNTVIDYETIKESTGVTVLDGKQYQQAFRESVKRILLSWKKKGYIQGYTDHKAGRTIKGVKIILQKPFVKIEDGEGSVKK